LRDLLAATDTRLSVIVLPLLQRPQKWAPQQTRARQRILAFLEANDIRHFDLFPVLEAALSEGVKVQEATGDTWHPNAAAAERFARHLIDAGLL
jgi:lysophospholipase L1-like esterase